MKEIALTQGQVAIVDDEDYELVRHHKWLALYAPSVRGYYAGRTVQKGQRRGTVLMHRVILGAQPAQLTDHINHNTLDNRRQNLRLCTHAENLRNMQKRGGASQYKGVIWIKGRQRWRAQLKVNKRLICLGHFADEKDAANAYDVAARRLFGTFAYTNFPLSSGLSSSD